MVTWVALQWFGGGGSGAGSGRTVSLFYYAFADLDTNALLRNDPESSDMNALQAAPLTGGREYNSSQVSVSVTAGRKHGVDVRLDQNDLLWFDATFGKSTGRLCARSSSSFFF